MQFLFIQLVSNALSSQKSFLWNLSAISVLQTKLRAALGTGDKHKVVLGNLKAVYNLRSFVTYGKNAPVVSFIGLGKAHCSQMCKLTLKFWRMFTVEIATGDTEVLSLLSEPFHVWN